MARDLKMALVELMDKLDGEVAVDFLKEGVKTLAEAEYSAGRRPPIPTEGGHPFRLIAATDSD